MRVSARTQFRQARSNLIGERKFIPEHTLYVEKPELVVGVQEVLMDHIIREMCSLSTCARSSVKFAPGPRWVLRTAR